MSDPKHATGTTTAPNMWSPAHDSVPYTIDPNQPTYQFFSLPKYTWKVVIGHNESHGLTIGYTDEQVPCWFHRKMQEFVLGFKWSKL